MFQPGFRDQVISIQQVPRARWAEDTFGCRGFQARAGVGLGQLALEGCKCGPDRLRAPRRYASDPRCCDARLTGWSQSLAQQTQRRRVFQRVRDHMRDKDRVCIGCGFSVSACRSSNRSKRAADRAQVEHDRGQHLRLGVGFGDPTAEILAPHPHRLTPARIGRHHVAGAVEIPADIQPVRDEFGKDQQSRACLRRSRCHPASGNCPDRIRLSVPAALASRRPAKGKERAAGPVFPRPAPATVGSPCLQYR